MTSPQQYEAACTCGQLRIRLSGQPRLVSSCHCLACQRRTGALFGSTAFFARNQVLATEGESRTYTRRADSGAALTFSFCPTCGSNVFWENERVVDTVSVAVGAFADPTFPRPVRTVWTVSKHGWLPFPEDIPHHAKSPP
jgi:hypothetical protein